MKICWDNLEGVYLTPSGNFSIKNGTYVEMAACNYCGDPYLTVKCRPSNYCNRSCALSGSSHPQYGKKFNNDWKSKLSISAKNRFLDNKNNPNYKGGVEKLGLPLFDTFSKQIDFAEETTYFINKEGLKLLQVRCTYCGKWFIPTITNVRTRIASLNMTTNGRTCGEGRFYCSQSCKIACPIFSKRKYPSTFRVTTSREVQPELRQMVLKRDNYTCQKCEEKDVELHCHHITGIVQNPIESADIDNCITLCKDCHSFAHQLQGCNTHELKCNGGI